MPIIGRTMVLWIGDKKTRIKHEGKTRLKKKEKLQIAGLFTGHDPNGSGQGGSKISRVGSGRVITFQKLTGRVGSGRVWSKGFKISRVGSGRVKRFSKSRGSGRVMTRKIRVTSRVKP